MRTDDWKKNKAWRKKKVACFEVLVRERVEWLEGREERRIERFLYTIAIL